ncbi:MAG: hypothetical protein H7256_01535, partial [Bdellovibrio sp.]|nr:hypothetical protein [Bdellovibrio sp.]
MFGSTKTFSPFIVGLAALSVGCSKSTIVSSTSFLDPRFQASDAVRFVQDGVSVTSNDVSDLASSLQISLALTINPPLLALTGGVQVYASDLQVAGNKVITAYNAPGNAERG